MMDGVFIRRVATDKGQGRCVGQRNTRRGATLGSIGRHGPQKKGKKRHAL